VQLFQKLQMDRIKGMIMGGALGDALGAPHEFRFQKKNYDGLLNKPIYFKFQYTPVKNSAVGQVTDDTEMTYALWESIIANNGFYDKESTILEYMKWARTAWAMGKNTRALFGNIKTIKGYRDRQAKLDENGQSNGSLMRCSPLAILDDWRRDTVADCNLTNPNSINRNIGLIYVKALRMALHGKSKKKIIDQIVESATELKIPAISTAVHEAMFRNLGDMKTHKDLNENKGWVAHAFHCAVWGLMHFDDYKSAIDAIILRYGDCDTNAAIAGNLLGAYYGFSAMVENIVTKKNIKVLLKCDPKKGDMSRGEYCIDKTPEILKYIVYDF